MKTLWVLCLLSWAYQMPASAQLSGSHNAIPAAATMGASTQPAGKPVARVNGAVLTDRDLLREEYLIFPYAQQHGGSIPKEMEPGIRDGALQMIIFEELLYQEALRRKMAVPNADMEKARAEFRRLFHSQAEYQKFLASEFQNSEEVLREKIRRSLLIEAMLKGDVASKSAVSQFEVKAYYDKNSARFQIPECFAIQTISFVAPQNATPQQLKEARQRAESALPQAKSARNYEEFGLLAEKISEDDYHVMMGDHKAVPWTRIAPQVLQPLQAMKPGQMTDILQVDQVYTIVRLISHTPAGKMKFEEVQSQLKTELQKKKVNDVRSALNKKLRKTAKVEVL
ncbi:MAG TPA: peptidylprolyl isomerase [Candidatus Cybelea sp.]|nr:peptidylprolyl isomerase [Candidatus Cybelea sp.]